MSLKRSLFLSSTSKTLLRVLSQRLSYPRTIHTTLPTMTPPPSTSSASPTSKPPTWSPTQYLKFSSQRNRPLLDLISQIPPLPNPENPVIVDLGCGPGNSTAALRERWPGGEVVGIDSSEDMLIRAKEVEGLRDVNFIRGRVEDFTGIQEEEEGFPQADLLFSNAVFHWLRGTSRITTLQRLIRDTLKPGGILALQVPDNYHEPTHACMRSVALQDNKPWTKYFADANVGELGAELRPDLDPIEGVEEWYEAFVGECESGGINVWRTEYVHFLPGVREVVEWVRGTGLMPFLAKIGDEGVREEFLAEYERALGGMYRVLKGDGEVKGSVALRYPRLFVVAVKK